MQRTSDQEWKVKSKEVFELASQTKQPSRKFKLKVEQIFLSAENDLEALEALGRLLRFYETTKARLEGYIKLLRGKLRGLMRDLALKEHTFGKTHLKRIDVWSIPDGPKGEVIYQKFVKTFGKERTDGWIKVAKEKVPAHEKTTYKISEEAIQEITDLDLELKAQDIINKWYIKVGPVPKRAKKGKPLKRERKKEK